MHNSRIFSVIYKCNYKTGKVFCDQIRELDSCALHVFLTSNNILPSSQFVCSLFYFGMFQNIILFLKLKIIN